MSDKPKDDENESWAGRGFGKKNQESKPPQAERSDDEDEGWIWK